MWNLAYGEFVYFIVLAIELPIIVIYWMDFLFVHVMFNPQARFMTFLEVLEDIIEREKKGTSILWNSEE